MIAWNDRRKARKAARATTRAQLSKMASKQTLRDAGSARPKQVGQLERSAVKREAQDISWSEGLSNKPSASQYKEAAKRISDKPSQYGLMDKEPMSKTPMVPKKKGN